MYFDENILFSVAVTNFDTIFYVDTKYSASTYFMYIDKTRVFYSKYFDKNRAFGTLTKLARGNYEAENPTCSYNCYDSDYCSLTRSAYGAVPRKWPPGRWRDAIIP